MESITLPELYCPFASEISAHADAVHRRTVDWALGVGLVEVGPAYKVFLRTNIGRLAGHYHPHSRMEDLQLVSDLYAWMFLRDDLCDETEIGASPEMLAAWNQRSLDILDSREAGRGDEPFEIALKNLRDRLLDRAPSSVWMRRFVRSVKEHFDSGIWEASNRVNGEVPDLETYVRMLPATGGLLLDSNLIEITNDMHLPSGVIEHPVVKALTIASCNVVIWSNDLFSLEKEIKSGDLHNLVFVLQGEYGLSIQEAVQRVAEMHDSEVALFMDLEGSLPSFGTKVDINLERYVSTLRSRMRGNLDWSNETARYRTAAVLAQAV